MARENIDNLTMEQYLTLTRGNQAPDMVRPEIGGNVNFEIKRVTRDAVMLRVFPITLTGAAKRWVDRLTPGTINTRDLLKKAFIKRYCPPSKTAKQLEDIHNFKQEGEETLYQAWERQSLCSSNNSKGMAAIVSKLDNLGRDMKKLKENVLAIQIGCQLCDGPHLDKEFPLNEDAKGVEEVKYGEGRSSPFNGAKYRVRPPGYYTRVDNRPPFGEKRPSLEELRNKHLEESARRSSEMEEWIKKIQESTEINTRNQGASLKNLETQIEQLTKEVHAKAATEVPTSSVGQCKAVYDDAPINKTSSNKANEIHGVSFIDKQKDDNLPSEGLPCQLPPKEINPGSFTLPCTIDSLDFYAMADLGASINVMPKSMFKHLKLVNLKETDMLVEMADMIKKVPLGIIENILIKIKEFLFSSDFVIIDMLKTSNGTMILGRPFLATIHAEIDVFNKEISLGIRDERIIFDMNKKSYEFTTPIEKDYMMNVVHGKDLMDIDCGLFLYESESYEFNRLLTIDLDIFTYDIDIQESYEEIIYKYGKICKSTRDRILKDHWKEKFGEEDDDIDEGWKDPKKCGEEKIDAMLDTVFNKLDDSWFSGETKDEDDLDGITDYLEPTSYDGFIESEDKAYKERLCNLLGMPYRKPPLILIERVEVTRYNIGQGETYTKTKFLGIDEIPRTSANVGNVRVVLMDELGADGGSFSKEVEFEAISTHNHMVQILLHVAITE
ncbi:reverse transcriptase domain-containing protein [Tanacetum coccineum]